MNIFLNVIFLLLFVGELWCSDEHKQLSKQARDNIRMILRNSIKPSRGIEEILAMLKSRLGEATQTKIPSQQPVLCSLCGSEIKPNLLHRLPENIRVIIANSSDNVRGKYLLCRKDEIMKQPKEGKTNLYYDHILKSHLQKRVQRIAIENIWLKKYEYENVFSNQKVMSGLRVRVSKNFIVALDGYYKKFMKDEENVLSRCNVSLFTFEQNDCLKKLYPEIAIECDAIFDGNEDVKLFAIILTKDRDGLYTLHRIADEGSFFTYVDKKNIQSSIVRRVIVFQKYTSKFMQNFTPIAKDKNFEIKERNFWMFDVIKDINGIPLLCECIGNRKQENDFWYNDFFIELMLKKGANVKVTDQVRWTPLHCCALTDNSYIADLLISKGADVSAKNSFFHASPLHIAVRNGNLNMVRLLINKGADVNAKDWKDRTPLDITEYQYRDIRLYLICGGAMVGKNEIMKEGKFDFCYNTEHYGNHDTILKMMQVRPKVLKMLNKEMDTIFWSSEENQ